MFIICPNCFSMAEAMMTQDVAHLECPACGCDFWVGSKGVILLIERREDEC